VNDEQRAGLNRFQETLDQLNLNLIQDDSPLRSEESDGWFRWMLRSQQLTPAEIEKELVRGVTYVQIFNQSNTYRGDLVRFRGTVKQAWRATAVSNPWGIKDYYVCWIHPHDGPNAPIVVHLSSLPAGFPPVGERPRREEDVVQYHEEVTVTGYFFKRLAYQGADGTYTAPLLIADTLQRHFTTEVQSARFEMTIPLFLRIAAGCFVVSLLVFGFIYWRTRSQDRRHLFDEEIARADLSGLKDVSVTPSVSETLQRLEEEHGRQKE
jgi:hypothetical protein